MHAHVHGVGPQIAGQYQAAALVKASAAQEAAATKRKLLRAAEEMGEDFGPDAVLLMGQWRGGRESEREEPKRETPTHLTYGLTLRKPMTSDVVATGSLISYRV